MFIIKYSISALVLTSGRRTVCDEFKTLCLHENFKCTREIERCASLIHESRNNIQYKSLKVIQNGGKSKKSKTSFGASPIEDLDGFYQRPFPEERKSDFDFIQFRKCLPKLSSLHRCHDGLVVRVLGFS